MTTINDWSKKCHEGAKANGWWDGERNVFEVLALIHSEVSELLEVLRKENYKLAKSWNTPVEDEFADIIIRTLDLSCFLGVDMDGAIGRKLDYNKTRGRRHGGLKA